MPHRTAWIVLAAVVSLSSTTARADSITLKDGKVVTGVVRQQDGGYDVTLEDGKHLFVGSADVKSVKLSNEGKVTEANAHERLLSLERSVENERDLDRAIDRYNQFITMNAGTDASKQADADLKVWQDRKTKGMLKVGKQWVTVADRDKLLIAAAQTVDQACSLIAAGKLDEATALLRTASEAEPDNVSYGYLNGVLELRREQYFEAKRSFDLVAANVADHPPTIVNLAVLAVQFKRWPLAVTLLDQALTLAPSSQEIVDNVIELEQLVPESTRRTGGFEKLAKRVAPLESALEERQAKRGLFRLGSKWVDKAALDAAKAELDAYEKKKADLEADYQASQEQARKAEEQIALTQRQMQEIEAQSIGYDANGRAYRRGYPSVYYDLQKDIALYQNQLAAAQAHIVDLRKQADVVKNNGPKSPFTGKLTPIDQRGVPVILPAGATTRAATQPTNVVPTDIGSSPTQPTTLPTTRGLFD